MESKRNINCDLMRVISMIFVIAYHTDSSFIKIPVLGIILSTILFTSNGLFYLLSGRFNLQTKFECAEDYKNYFFKKNITIFFPFILMTCLLSLWDILDSGTWNGLELYIKRTYVALMHTNSTNHLWFMYGLIGMLLGAPFLAKMLQNMSNWELNLLFGIGIVWNIVSIYLCTDFNINFSYYNWMLSGFSIYFFAGYYCTRIVNDLNKKRVYIFGTAGFIITVLGRYLIPDRYLYSTDSAVAFIVFTMAVYTFLEKEVVINNEYLKKGICFLSKYSFLVYMIHWNVLHKITALIITGESTFFKWISTILITLIISLLLSIILNTFIIYPVQEMMKKILKHTTLQRSPK